MLFTRSLPDAVPVLIVRYGLLHPTLAVAHLATSRIDSLTRFRRLFHDLNTGTVTRVAFDFVF
jgi:hypothetical protein